MYGPNLLTSNLIGRFESLGNLYGKSQRFRIRGYVAKRYVAFHFAQSNRQHV